MLLIHYMFKYEVELVKIHTIWYMRYKITKISDRGETYKITRLYKIW